MEFLVKKRLLYKTPYVVDCHYDEYARTMAAQSFKVQPPDCDGSNARGGGFSKIQWSAKKLYVVVFYVKAKIDISSKYNWYYAHS